MGPDTGACPDEHLVKPEKKRSNQITSHSPADRGDLLAPVEEPPIIIRGSHCLHPSPQELRMKSATWAKKDLRAPADPSGTSVSRMASSMSSSQRSRSASPIRKGMCRIRNRG